MADVAPNGRAMFLGQVVIALALIVGALSTFISPLLDSATAEGAKAAEVAGLKGSVQELKARQESALRELSAAQGRIEQMSRDLDQVDELQGEVQELTKWIVDVKAHLSARGWEPPPVP